MCFCRDDIFLSDIQILLASCMLMATSGSLTWERKCLSLSALQFPHLSDGVKQDKWLSRSLATESSFKIKVSVRTKLASLVAQTIKCLSAMLETDIDPWVGKIPWRRKWQPTPVFLPGESHGQRSLVGYNPWGCTELDMTERLYLRTKLVKVMKFQLSYFTS